MKLVPGVAAEGKSRICSVVNILYHKIVFINQDECIFWCSPFFSNRLHLVKTVLSPLFLFYVDEFRNQLFFHLFRPLLFILILLLLFHKIYQKKNRRKKIIYIHLFVSLST